MSDLPRFFFSNEMIEKKHKELKDNLEKKNEAAKQDLERIAKEKLDNIRDMAKKQMELQKLDGQHKIDEIAKEREIDTLREEKNLEERQQNEKQVKVSTTIQVVEGHYEKVNDTKAEIEKLKNENKRMEEEIKTNTTKTKKIEQQINVLTKNIDDNQAKEKQNTKILQKLTEQNATQEQSNQLREKNDLIIVTNELIQTYNDDKDIIVNRVRPKLSEIKNYPNYGPEQAENDVDEKLKELITKPEDFNTLVEQLKNLIANDEVPSDNKDKLVLLNTKLDLLKEISQLKPFNANYVTIASNAGEGQAMGMPDFTDLGEDIEKIFNAYVLIHIDNKIPLNKYQTCIDAITGYVNKEIDIDKEARSFLELDCERKFGVFNEKFSTNISPLLNNILNTDNTCKTVAELSDVKNDFDNFIDKIVEFFNDVFSNEIKKMWTTTNAAERIKIHLNLIKTILDSMLQGNQASRTKIAKFKSSVAMISANNNLPDILTEESNCIVRIDDFEDFITEYNEAQKTLKTSFEGDSLLKKLYEKLNLFDNFETVHTIQDGSNSINDSHPSNLDEKYTKFLEQQATFRENLTKIIDAIKCLNTFIIEKDKELVAEKKAAAEEKAKEKVAIRLQSVYREKNTRKQLAAEKAAAEALQAAFRGLKARKKAAKLRQQKEERKQLENNAAIKIQTAERQRKAKETLNNLKQERTRKEQAAAVIIQSAQRKKQAYNLSKSISDERAAKAAEKEAAKAAAEAKSAKITEYKTTIESLQSRISSLYEFVSKKSEITVLINAANSMVTENNYLTNHNTIITTFETKFNTVFETVKTRHDELQKLALTLKQKLNDYETNRIQDLPKINNALLDTSVEATNIDSFKNAITQYNDFLRNIIGNETKLGKFNGAFENKPLPSEFWSVASEISLTISVLSEGIRGQYETHVDGLKRLDVDIGNIDFSVITKAGEDYKKLKEPSSSTSETVVDVMQKFISDYSGLESTYNFTVFRDTDFTELANTVAAAAAEKASTDKAAAAEKPPVCGTGERDAVARKIGSLPFHPEQRDVDCGFAKQILDTISGHEANHSHDKIVIFCGMNFDYYSNWGKKFFGQDKFDSLNNIEKIACEVNDPRFLLDNRNVNEMVLEKSENDSITKVNDEWNVIKTININNNNNNSPYALQNFSQAERFDKEMVKNCLESLIEVPNIINSYFFKHYITEQILKEIQTDNYEDFKNLIKDEFQTHEGKSELITAYKIITYMSEMGIEKFVTLLVHGTSLIDNLNYNNLLINFTKLEYATTKYLHQISDPENSNITTITTAQRNIVQMADDPTGSLESATLKLANIATARTTVPINQNAQELKDLILETDLKILQSIADNESRPKAKAQEKVFEFLQNISIYYNVHYKNSFTYNNNNSIKKFLKIIQHTHNRSDYYSLFKWNTFLSDNKTPNQHAWASYRLYEAINKIYFTTDGFLSWSEFLTIKQIGTKINAQNSMLRAGKQQITMKTLGSSESSFTGWKPRVGVLPRRQGRQVTNTTRITVKPASNQGKATVKPYRGGGKKMTRKKKGKKPQKRTRHHKKNVTRPLRKNKTKPTRRK